MNDARTGTALLEMLHRAREAEVDFAWGLTDEDCAASETRDFWSATYTLAHITAAKERLTHALRAARAGDLPGLEHDEQQVYAENHRRPWTAVENEARRVSADSDLESLRAHALFRELTIV